ncbi:hypothetical protein DFQ27_002243 [Actinomortierella ambigua]|uniref:Uncharacterized protein n=1 Tax=Actinomortierella ambigua TaxID=1343610 RepID=A0A9P6U7B2_9FUNG|nr:hypothetical protein DFQ27_002243 [Actinomortierella ambigua]
MTSMTVATAPLHCSSQEMMKAQSTLGEMHAQHEQSVMSASVSQPKNTSTQLVRELSDEDIKALLSKTRRHKKNRSAGKHSGTSPLLRQVLRRSLLGHIGKHQRKVGK